MTLSPLRDIQLQASQAIRNGNLEKFQETLNAGMKPELDYRGNAIDRYNLKKKPHESIEQKAMSMVVSTGTNEGFLISL